MTDDQTAPDPYAEHPEEPIFPGAGRRVTDEEREAALRAGLMGATVGDEADTEEDDSSAHESEAGSEDVDQQGESDRHDD